MRESDAHKPCPRASLMINSDFYLFHSFTIHPLNNSFIDLSLHPFSFISSSIRLCLPPSHVSLSSHSAGAGFLCLLFILRASCAFLFDRRGLRKEPTEDRKPSLAEFIHLFQKRCRGEQRLHDRNELWVSFGMQNFTSCVAHAYACVARENQA